MSFFKIIARVRVRVRVPKCLFFKIIARVRVPKCLFLKIIGYII